MSPAHRLTIDYTTYRQVLAWGRGQVPQEPHAQHVLARTVALLQAEWDALPRRAIAMPVLPFRQRVARGRYARSLTAARRILEGAPSFPTPWSCTT